jgi:two-component system sensor histidine kinase/response regulator
MGARSPHAIICESFEFWVLPSCHFPFKLPAEFEMPSTSSNGKSPKTILIVDDDAHLSAIMALGLETHGYAALCAADALIGLEMANAHMPDLILCDIDMPGKDGRRMLKEMRADPKLADRQFVLMTGRATLANQRTGMDLGADDFLLKPFDLSALIGCVEARIQRAEVSRRTGGRGSEKPRDNLNSALPREFFTPLAGILGLTELLQRELDRMSKEEIRDHLRELHDAGRRLQRRLSNYLVILGLDTKEGAGESVLLDEDAVVKALHGGASAAAERNSRTGDITLEIAGACLRASPGDLNTLSGELVDNAMSFSERNTPVKVQVRPDSGQLRITVTDIGRGMTPKQLEQFDTLQGRGSKLYGEESIGLGLALVQRLVQQLGGQFRLESEAGKGTISHVSLPIYTN